jgi:hypothetical protein
MCTIHWNCAGNFENTLILTNSFMANADKNNPLQGYYVEFNNFAML